MAEMTSVQLAGGKKQKLFFSGPPTRLQGTIRLSNPTADKVKLRSASVKSGNLMGAARLPLTEVPLAVRLSPGEQMNAQSVIDVDPQTPPGSYSLELDIGGQTVEATAFVTEVVDFRIEPGAVTILAGQASKYEREFVIENAGNVPLPLGERCEAPLLDSVDLVTSMLMGLHKAKGHDTEDQVESWLKEWGQIEAGTLVVSRAPIILGPGQKMTATAVFEMPPGLRPLRHYRASLQLYNATLAVDVYTTAKGGSNGGTRPATSPKEGKGR